MAQKRTIHQSIQKKCVCVCTNIYIYIYPFFIGSKCFEIIHFIMSLARVLQATLQEVYAVERKLHIHRQRELLSDPPRWARGRGAGIWGIRFENHHLSRDILKQPKGQHTKQDETSVMDALKLILWRPWLFSGPLHCFSTLLPFCGGTLLNWCMLVSIGAPDTLVSHAWPKVPLLILYLARPSAQYRRRYLHSFVCLCALLVHSCVPVHSRVSIHFSVYLSAYLHIATFVSVDLYLRFSFILIYLFISKLFVNIVTASLSNGWYIHEAICLSIYTLPVSTSMHSSVCLSVRTSIYHLYMIDRSINLSIYPIYPCLYLSIYLPGFLFMLCLGFSL